MTFRLEYSDRAKRDIIDLPSQKIKDQIESALLCLSHEPSLGKLLKGDFSGLWSYRSGDYRIIYRLYKSELRMMVITVGDRRDVYRDRRE